MKRTLALAIGTATLALGAGIAWAGNPVNCLPGPSCTGTAGADQIQGTDEEDNIKGLGGPDDIRPQGADDIANGGPGGDYLSEIISDGEDTLVGGPGDDSMEGGVQGDVLRGGSGDERANRIFRGLQVPEFRQISMYGDQGGDRLFGGGGRDSMEGEEGADLMKGGAGNDYLDAVDDDAEGTRDRLIAGGASTVIRPAPATRSMATASRRCPPSRLSPEAGGTMRLTQAFATVIGTTALAAGVALAGAPDVNCTGGPCTGTSEGETLNGTDQADQINALGGNDFLDGHLGNDALRGGPGSDESEGDGGDDRHVGGPGNDSMSEFGAIIFPRGASADSGEDIMRGGGGSDFAEGNDRGDTILGGRGNERLRQATRASRHQRGIFGPASCFRGFCSRLYGDAGNDTINGGRGKDYMEGELGADTYVGGPGDDVIDAINEDSGARDKVSCGPGNDFVFAAPSEDKVADDCEHVRTTAPPTPTRHR